MEIRAPQEPLCVLRGKGKTKRKDPTSFAVTELQDPSVSRSVVFGCYGLPTVFFQPEVILLLTGLNDFSLKVWAVNSAGKAPSSWTRCRTGPAPPEGLGAPRFHAVSSTQAVVNISAPGKPNGIVSFYRLFSNSTGGAELVVSNGVSLPPSFPSTLLPSLPSN